MTRYTITGTIFVLFASSALAQDDLYSRAMGQTCAGCHGTNGIPAVTYIPALAGLKRADFITAMEAYRDGTRTATIMNRVAPAFTDSEIAAMADYFATLPAVPVSPTFRLAPGASE